MKKRARGPRRPSLLLLRGARRPLTTSLSLALHFAHLALLWPLQRPSRNPPLPLPLRPRLPVMTNMFKAANAVNRNAVRAQRKQEQGNSDVKGEEGFGSNVQVLEERSRGRSSRAQSQRDVEVDQECVLYGEGP